jgi:hypothetical protein
MIVDTEATHVQIDKEVYAGSRPESWMQPSAGCYYFVTIGEKVYGHLMSETPISSRSNVSIEDSLEYGTREAEPVYEEESEDTILVDSGILPRLIAQARQESPSSDWERDLFQL